MSATLDGPAAPAPGLRHVCLLYETPADLADAALPELRAALDRDDDVTVVADRRIVRVLRERLGADADRVHYPAPGDTLASGGPGVVRDMRAQVPRGPAVRAGRRALVLSQSDLFTGSDEELDVVEDAVNRTLADMPVTILCCYGLTADPCRVATGRRGHPLLLVDGHTCANPDHRPRDPDAFVPRAVWGAPALWIAFHDTSDLRRIRDGVARVAADAGLGGEAVDAAVLAVHETAVLACAAVSGADGAECVLEVHVDPGELTSEVRASRPLVTAGDPDSLAHLRPFCRSITLHDEHVVRVRLDAVGPPG